METEQASDLWGRPMADVQGHNEEHKTASEHPLDEKGSGGFPATGHGIVKCSCGNIISQCRCPGPHATQTRQHPACGREPTASEQGVQHRCCNCHHERSLHSTRKTDEAEIGCNAYLKGHGTKTRCACDHFVSNEERSASEQASASCTCESAPADALTETATGIHWSPTCPHFDQARACKCDPPG